MTGRGDGRIFRPSPNPVVRIGLSLSVSPSTLPSGAGAGTGTEDSVAAPFYLVINARILSTPHPDLPITLATQRNPFAPLGWNSSFHPLKCIDPAAVGKRINICPYAPPYASYDADNLTEWMDFVTVPSQGSDASFRVKHEVSRSWVDAANVEKGERYVAEMTNRCMGAVWWGFGEMPAKGYRIGLWNSAKYDDGTDRWVKRGERPDDLALVDEGGPVEFLVD